ncbi:nucleotidyltransferase [Clostridium novyi]|uniref:nucleotidyltransferase n=1 Tax=Clostridium novyi TaxID=1542 RepID=UPI0004D8C5EF|nr:nucleotidyltransferase [Clostridium novyi]KEH89596.1 hypothetical protein Z967_08475 [Clostridium novyi A str. 4540]KEH95503.1 hypothetical protein Z964_07070 [Clostridium novyi A str. GD211209]
MNITGIITEYNPLHKGHIYHINKTKELTSCDGIVCIMSGNFVQRGIPAIMDKWTRCELALNSGVDLVIELPSVYSLSSAEFFAYGSISLLNSIGVINNICFGSESGNIDDIKSIAKILNNEPSEFKNHLKDYLDKGVSYPVARSKALVEYFNDNLETQEILKSSNNILGIEYCKSLLKLKSTIIPYTIQRKGSNYNDDKLESKFSSATAIRSHVKNSKNINILKDILPSKTFNYLYDKFNNNNLVFEDSMFSFIKYKSLTLKNKLENLPDVKEGLHNKIYSELKNSNSFYELVSNIKSKRYAYTRISRILCQYFIGMENFNLEYLRTKKSPYGRVLGFNDIGRKILKEMKNKSSIPIYMKLPKTLNDTLKLDIQSTYAYSMINKSVSYDSDFKTSPIYLK